ncbi:MAG: acyl-CoA thioesterase [Pseudomonadota bacterium]
MPADTNPNGDIFGGWLLSQMDVAGGAHAYQATKLRVVTVAIDALTFHQPVKVGDEVSCYCETVHRGTTSIGVYIETWVRRRDGSASKKVTEGKFTYVAIDGDGKPQKWTDTGVEQ